MCLELRLPLTKAIGLVAVTLVLTVLFLNGLVMLVSPAAWFRLPRYFALRGTLSERQYLAKRAGRIQVRVLGAVLTGFAGSMLLLFVETVSASPGLGPVSSLSLGLLPWALSVLTCLGVIGCGVVMLFRPSWWTRKYMNGIEGLSDRSLERITRVGSVVVISAGVLFLLQCLASW